jgi:hypothetical protein
MVAHSALVYGDKKPKSYESLLSYEAEIQNWLLIISKTAYNF